MVNKADYAKIVLADKVQLIIGSDDFNSLVDIKIISKHPKITEVSRAGRQKYYEPVDAMIKFSIELTQNILAELITKHTRNAQGALSTFAWSFKITAKDASTSTLVINGELSELELDAPGTGSAKAVCGVEMSDQILD